MSDSAISQIRVGVDTFSGISELRSSGACFSSSSAVLQILVDWLMVFSSGKFGVTRWLEKPPDPSVVQAQEPKTRVVPSGTLLALLDPAY